jgi:hypothetical protein
VAGLVHLEEAAFLPLPSVSDRLDGLFDAVVADAATGLCRLRTRHTLRATQWLDTLRATQWLEGRS